MAKKKAQSSKKTNSKINLDISSWISSFEQGKKVSSKGQTGRVYFLGGDATKKFQEIVKSQSLKWQKEALIKSEKEFVYFVGQDGPVWLLKPKTKNSVGHGGLLDEHSYTWARDQFGSLVGQAKAHQLDQIVFYFESLEKEQELGALIGLDLGVYNFKIHQAGKHMEGLPKGSFATKIDKKIIAEASQRALAINLARHFVNLPPNIINPTSMSTEVIKELKLSKNSKVTVWNAAKLQQEGMGLHLAVGVGAEFPPCLVHISYRPTKKSSLKPVAFVGKGITFDTGGLDIKPSAGMRLMKKDMGGAASVLALAKWASDSQYPAPLDFYLALAENAVDGKSFRPSDIITARNGLKVEIDNTDAEGRLVLADALDVACTRKGVDEPSHVINVATLTGAIKVGLGADIAGLFSNDDELAQALTQAGQRTGDLNWRMPLYEKYFADLSSPFADFKNSAGGFGGAITAALFLQRFVGTKKWAHLDVYAWADKAQGVYSAAGGNGQPVQCLIDFLTTRLMK